MKYLCLYIFLTISTIAYSQDTLKQRGSSGRGDQGHKDGHYPGRGMMMDTLDNRKLVFKGIAENKCTESGRIVLIVQVNPKGSVVSAVVGRGTTSTSKCLQEAAIAAALLSTFEKDKTATALQAGRLVFNFKVQ